MTEAVSGYGTLLMRERPGSPGTFDVVEEIYNLSGPGESLDTIEATHMTSPGARREYIASLLDSGEMSFEANFLPQAAVQGGCRDDMNSRTLRTWRLQFSDDDVTTYEFDAFVTQWEPSANVDDKLTVAGTLKISSLIEAV
jgi:hypothetical protein